MTTRTFRERLLDGLLWLIVPAAAYASYAAAFVLDPFSMRHRARLRLTPELRRFPSALSRARAIVAACFRPWAAGLALAAASLGAGYFTFRWLSAAGSTNVERRLPALLVSLLVAWWVFWWLDVGRTALFRSRARQSIREELVRFGLPTCSLCGEAAKSLSQPWCEPCGKEQSIS